MACPFVFGSKPPIPVAEPIPSDAIPAHKQPASGLAEELSDSTFPHESEQPASPTAASRPGPFVPVPNPDSQWGGSGTAASSATFVFGRGKQSASASAGPRPLQGASYEASTPSDRSSVHRFDPVAPVPNSFGGAMPSAFSVSADLPAPGGAAQADLQGSSFPEAAQHSMHGSAVPSAPQHATSGTGQPSSGQDSPFCSSFQGGNEGTRMSGLQPGISVGTRSPRTAPASARRGAHSRKGTPVKRPPAVRVSGAGRSDLLEI